MEFKYLLFAQVSICLMSNHIFPNNKLLFFIAITQQALKVYFAWKQLKADYSKNIWNEENCRHSFACLLVGFISVGKKTKKPLQFCWCRSSEYRNINSFWPNFDPNFTNIWWA